MSYEASCPSCGATIVFALGASLLRVCEHCGVAVARKGSNLAAYGRVAELIPTPSVLGLGVEGGYTGAPRFALVGRLQLDYGEGTWDEWLMGFAGENWAWLSESQGKFHYLAEAPLPPVAEFEKLEVGQAIDLGPPGVFVVTEVRSARFMSAQGELPFDVEPGSLLNYADLSGPGGQFGTLDYGTGSKPEALYVGREVTLDELGIATKGLPTEEERRARAAGQALSCPQCGGPIEVRAPDHTQRVACPYCGSLLDATKDFAVLEALERVPIKPLIPLGSKGRLDGTEWTLIGFMERSVTVEGDRYPWGEYLLYEPLKGFRWLTESSGHWSFVEPVNAGDVAQRGARRCRFRDLDFRHFQGGTARVDHVLGEFYWTVSRGDLVETADYVHPPWVLSMERAIAEGSERRGEQGGKRRGDQGGERSPETLLGLERGEMTWSLGTYRKPREIQEAFRLPAPPRTPTGVAPNQPCPWTQDAKAVYSYALLSLGGILAVFVWLAVLGGRTVHQETVAIAPQAVSGGPESAIFAGPIFITSEGNVEVRVKAPVDNSWLYLDGALINEESGAVDEFDVEASYYHGYDSDGSWKEGSQEGAAYVGSVPPGRYTLRLEPQWDPSRRPRGYDLTVRTRVPRLYQFLLAVATVSVFPLLVVWRQFRFEGRRWSDSDHPWFESE